MTGGCWRHVRVVRLSSSEQDGPRYVALAVPSGSEDLAHLRLASEGSLHASDRKKSIVYHGFHSQALRFACSKSSPGRSDTYSPLDVGVAVQFYVAVVTALAVGLTC